MRLFILLSLISFQAFGMNWFDMSSGEEYILQQDISLPENKIK